MPLLEELADYLQAEGVGTQGSDLFAAFMPDSPSALTVVYETPGPGPMFGFGKDKPHWSMPKVQVICRAAGYAAARAKAQEVYEAFNKVTNQTISTSSPTYLSIEATQDPFKLKDDDQSRPWVACNYQVRREST